MVKLIAIIIILALLQSNLFSQQIAQRFDYSGYNNILEKNVEGELVDYNNIIKVQDDLYTFIASIEKYSPDTTPAQFPAKNDQLAFWINAYNALILKKIIENYPVKSIKSINVIGFTVWLTKNVIGGERISFKSLEDDIIQDRFSDPRIHFAINCASISCPPLKNKAYVGEQLDAQLNASTAEFINRQKNFRVDAEQRKLYLSAIFDWYEEDFLDWLEQEKKIENAHILDYIGIYYKNKIDKEWYGFDIEFNDYDWSLNDIKNKASKNMGKMDAQ